MFIVTFRYFVMKKYCFRKRKWNCGVFFHLVLTMHAILIIVILSMIA